MRSPIFNRSLGRFPQAYAGKLFDTLHYDAGLNEKQYVEQSNGVVEYGREHLFTLSKKIEQIAWLCYS